MYMRIFQLALFVFLGQLFLACAYGHKTLSYPCPRYNPDGENCPPLPNGEVDDYDTNSPIGSVQLGTEQPLCKHTTPWPQPAATWNAGDTISVKFVPGGAGHGGGHCEFSFSYDGGKTFVVVDQVLQHCFYNGPSTDNTPIVSSYDVKLPPNLPGSNKAIFAWSWVNALGNREFYMNCADVVISGSSTSFTGKQMTIANYGSYPTIPEFGDDYTTGLSLYTTNITNITVQSDGTVSGNKEGGNKNSSSKVNSNGSRSKVAPGRSYVDYSDDNGSDFSSYTSSSLFNSEEPSDEFDDVKCDNDLYSDDYMYGNNNNSESNTNDKSSSESLTSDEYDDNDKCDDENSLESSFDSLESSSSEEYPSSEYADLSESVASIETLAFESPDFEPSTTNSSEAVSSEPSISELDGLDSSEWSPRESSSGPESYFAVAIQLTNEPELVCEKPTSSSDMRSEDMFYSGVYASYDYISSNFVYNSMYIEMLASLGWETEAITFEITVTLTESPSGLDNELSDIDSKPSSTSSSEPSNKPTNESSTNSKGYPMFEFSSPHSSEIST
ncbi:hypothetical protein GGI25_003628 [Coemansia spiralis]|uniref:Chitin-binding type-4 domain-containing protein n=2 Tax=Coemansia TaxID=4863 RepID=A0A9W8KXX2_9FUNG|nr:hypothetical protein EDC05_000034 [Coemansia umbellata]KAJ2626099.1 hypothetical protein GGI26_000183 [Coemansia sp. RSA 1358]KAJ2676241.1 hypothetical protein GGI25_003628 [Coemansia spiralis]